MGEPLILLGCRSSRCRISFRLGFVVSFVSSSECPVLDNPETLLRRPGEEGSFLQGNAKERKRERGPAVLSGIQETRKTGKSRSWFPGFLINRPDFAFWLGGFPLAGYSLQE